MMKFIKIENEDTPKVMFTPFVYFKITECSSFYFVKNNSKKNPSYKIIYKEKENKYERSKKNKTVHE